MMTRRVSVWNWILLICDCNIRSKKKSKMVNLYISTVTASNWNLSVWYLCWAITWYRNNCCFPRVYRYSWYNIWASDPYSNESPSYNVIHYQNIYTVHTRTCIHITLVQLTADRYLCGSMHKQFSPCYSQIVFNEIKLTKLLLNHCTSYIDELNC